MQLGRMGLVGAIAGVVLGGLFAAAGCEGVDDEVSSADQAELHGGYWSHRRHRGPDAGSVGGTAGTTGGGGVTGGAPGGRSGATTVDAGAPTDCDICTQAQACCIAVRDDNAGCTFSAATCASESGAARPAYVNACLVDLMAVRGVRTAAQLPAECR